jgi:hypothetical protein
MHVATFLFGLGVLILPSLFASSANDFTLTGSKRSHSFDVDDNDDFMAHLNDQDKETGQMIIGKNYCFPSNVFGSNEAKVAEIIAEYSEDSNDMAALDKLINYSAFFPEETVYQILSIGEISLMSMHLYYETYISDDRIGQALRNLFLNTSCRTKLLNVLRVHINLLLNDPDLITPKSVLIVFKNNSIDLFGILAEKERERTSRIFNTNYSKCYKLFFKLFKEINLVHLTSPRDLYSFNKLLIKSQPDFLINLDSIDLYRIALNFIYWDDVEELNQMVSTSTDIVIFIPEKCSSLLHFATEWESVECLDFLLDLVHEMAISEPEIGGVSPFVYALILRSKAVLDIYAKHGFNDETTITIDSMLITGAQIMERSNDPKNFHYFRSLIKK